MASIKSVNLNFEDGKSDKFYNIAINDVSADGKYTVDFHYGRNGTDGQRGTKTKEPVTLDKAQQIYDKVVKQKMAKGYV